MLSLDSLNGTSCQNKLERQRLEPTSWFMRKSRCIRLAEMNGLVVRTMDRTGCARLNSNKDANNRRCSCGQGCRSWPFTGEGHGHRCRRSHSKRLFRWHPCQIPQMTLPPAHGPDKGLQTNPNKRRMSAVLSRNPVPSPLPQTIPKRSGYRAGLSRPHGL